MYLNGNDNNNNDDDNPFLNLFKLTPPKTIFSIIISTTMMMKEERNHNNRDRQPFLKYIYINFVPLVIFMCVIRHHSLCIFILFNNSYKIKSISKIHYNKYRHIPIMIQ